MRPSQKLTCDDFPCGDVRPECYAVPAIEVRPSTVSMVLISEAAPPDPSDYYYARGKPLFAQTTLLAFQDAGLAVASMKDLLAMGIYATTAVKCGKTAYSLKPATILACSRLLEQELRLLPNVKVLLLMGDVAIQAINAIAGRAGEGRVIPAGSTYKLRGAAYTWRDMRVFPSYLQAGPSFFIEKSKRRMIAEDIAAGLRLVQSGTTTRAG